MSNLLDIDLNEFVSKEILDTIKSLNKQLTNSQNKLSEQYNELAILKKQVADSELPLGLLNQMRTAFTEITNTTPNENGYYISKQQNQFLFIEQILLNFFNIKKEANGWYNMDRYYVKTLFATHLAVNFYSNKDVVINLLKILMPDCHKEISFIKSFKMPFDYTKEEVIEYVKSPKYNTNGCIFGITEYWIENGAGKINMPHDLIMKNPFILDNDVFDILINSIKKRVSYYYYLFSLPKYNENISKEQLMLLGECLINIPDEVFGYGDVKEIIVDNLKSFNNKTLDYLYTLIRSNNRFSMFHWENFPTEYQMLFLKEKSLNEILKIFNSYNCTWTIEEKQSFLKDYLN